jgi:hypothetical protein
MFSAISCNVFACNILRRGWFCSLVYCAISSDRQHYHQHARRNETEDANRAEMLQKESDHETGEDGGQPAERIDEANGAGAYLGRKEFGLIRVIGEGHQRVGASKENSE